MAKAISILLTGCLLAAGVGAASAQPPAAPVFPAPAVAPTFPLIPPEIPPTVALKAMGAGWYRAKIDTMGGNAAKAGGGLTDLMMMGGMSGGRSGVSEMMLLNNLLGGNSGGPDAPYFTQGKTLNLVGETFLIAYRLKNTLPSFMELLADSERNGGKEPDFDRIFQQNRVTGDTPAQLVLINIRSVATLGELRLFALDAEIADANRMADFVAMISKKDEGNSDTPKTAPAPPPTTTKPAPAPVPKKPGKKP